jgi:mRNA interferase RelE/StbE
LLYEVQIVLSAEKELDRLPLIFHNRIVERILSLEENPRPKGIKKLSGREEYRLRAGDYRILYIINDKDRIVTVMAVGHRREVYK